MNMSKEVVSKPELPQRNAPAGDNILEVEDNILEVNDKKETISKLVDEELPHVLQRLSPGHCLIDIKNIPERDSTILETRERLTRELERELDARLEILEALKKYETSRVA